MSERRNQIILAAIELIADQGYASLSMRALAREVGMKLGALQYHFKTADQLMIAIVGHIASAYQTHFDLLEDQHTAPSLTRIIAFILDDEAGRDITSDRLWPQLWAMQLVEPLVAELVERIYAEYLSKIEQALVAADADDPTAEAICLMSMLEGATIFVGVGRRWHQDGAKVAAEIFNYVRIRYGADA
ncbi:TetR/AcrR family transcriptional regulator [Pseudomonadales bacterium]|nr:TetR/AcrR family transcriptional regulator [Pseudomonadales bacterium]